MVPTPVATYLFAGIGDRPGGNSTFLWAGVFFGLRLLAGFVALSACCCSAKKRSG